MNEASLKGRLHYYFCQFTGEESREGFFEEGLILMVYKRHPNEYGYVITAGTE